MTPGFRGIARPLHMRQFYEAYSTDAIVSALPRQLPGTGTDEAFA